MPSSVTTTSPASAISPASRGYTSTSLSLLTLLLNLRPSTRFNHHLRSAPPAISPPPPPPPATTPWQMSHGVAFATAFATVLNIPAAALLAAPSDSATTLQFHQPAGRRPRAASAAPTHVRVLSRPAYLASVADTIPLLSIDPLLAPVIADTASWPTSASLDLSEAASTFSALMSLPLARTLTIPTPWQAESPPAFARLFDYATDSFSLALLPSVARSHLQSTRTCGRHVARVVR